MNLTRLAEQNVKNFGEYTAFIFEGREYTNVAMESESFRLAHALREIGVERGDRVIVHLPNCPEVLLGYQAILKLGAIILPVLFLLGPDELTYIAEDSGATAIITSPELIPKVLEVKAAVPTLERVVVVGEGEYEGTHSYREMVEAHDGSIRTVETDDDETAVIIYTSGTTGKPKGVCLSHANLYADAMAACNATETTRDEIGLGALPMAHIFGIITMNAGLIFGIKGVMMRWFTADDALRLIEELKVTTFAGVPTMFTYLLECPEADKYDTSSLEKCTCAGAPMPEELLVAFEKKFGCRVYEGYGLTETAAAVTLCRPDTPRRPGSAGTALEGIELRIFDEEDRALPPGEPGEIVVRGPIVMKGYYNRPEETERALRGGWLHTGDVGCLDADGWLYITERMKDMIIRGGLNIYPREIEEVLHEHPSVSEAAVVGVQEARMGEQVWAFIVPRSTETLSGDKEKSAEEIVAFCQERLAKYKIPKRVEFRPYLPKNPIGKVLKKDLRAEAAELLGREKE